MTVLVINAGSSSVKYALVEPHGDGPATVLAHGVVERVGSSSATLRHVVDGGTHESAVDADDHTQALAAVANAFDEHGPDVRASLQAVGHRVVHGGESFSGPVVVDEDVLTEVDRLSVLAPLHNPVNVAGIRAAQERFGDVPHVAVFDTAFHADLPAVARTYAVPREWREDHGVRRYGFHGTSHAYVSRTAAAWLQAERDVEPSASRVVVLHLGNGASACAVLGGRSIDTSMGLTPLAGLVMGTRSGDVDPALAGHLHRVADLAGDVVEEQLNRSSGLLGLTGESDLRDVRRLAEAGDVAAAEALELYAYRIRAYVGAYAVALGGLDAVVLTAGVGEHDTGIRASVLLGLDVLGVRMDPDRNEGVLRDGGPVQPVSTDDSPVAALVVPTDEEGEIARQAVDLLRG
ncbi:acetate/propionate family kinase [Aquipuribacter sp. MA13-6]|uniref:acetate/propionate family kinase n=1 Tax=unclassified Aquipuribacter TaxID=2635084 RepID=UPI003EEEA551